MSVELKKTQWATGNVEFVSKKNQKIQLFLTKTHQKISLRQSLSQHDAQLEIFSSISAQILAFRSSL